MDCLNDPGIETIVIMSSAQVGKTEFLLNIIGYYVDQDPAPILALQPTLQMAETFSKDRLAPMVRDTPALQGKIKDARSRDSGNTLLKKNFHGGHITLAGANSPASLASRPIRIVLCDEVDRYPASAGAEGDPVNLARKRTTTFFNRKIVLTSTPTLKGASRIEAAFEVSDQRRYYVSCPDCGYKQHLKWSNVTWTKSEPDKAQYACDDCGVLINESKKPALLSTGEWIAEGDPSSTAGFHLNELYSPWRKWGEVVQDFLVAKKNTETLKTWVNTSLGETWEDEGEGIDEGALFARRESYSTPKSMAVLTAGIDVQGDRLEVEVVGWSAGEESYGLEYKIIPGDPSQADVWKELTAFLRKSYTDEDGATYGIYAACIDSGGHHTQIVYDYCEKRQIQRLYAIKGMAGEDRPIASPRDTVGYPQKRKAIVIGVDAGKSLLFSYLHQQEKGPGYCHFPLSYDQEYFQQLTAEKVKTKFKNGYPHRQWVKVRARNEALDCRVYALAALKLTSPNLDIVHRVTNPTPMVRQKQRTRRESQWFKR